MHQRTYTMQSEKTCSRLKINGSCCNLCVSAAGSRQLALPLDTTKYGGVSASKSNGSFATAPASPLDGLVDDEEDEEEDDDELELPQPHLTRALSAEDEFYDARGMYTSFSYK